MDIIQPKTLREIADGAAFESRVPWRVLDLRARALEAYRTAVRRTASSGLSREQASAHHRRFIQERVEETAGRMDPLPPDQPDQSKPAPEQMEAALEAFTTKQWTTVERFPPIELSPPMEGWPIVEARYGLMQSIGREEVEALLAHIREHRDDLAQRIGARKLGAIEGRAIVRHTELTLPEDRPKMVPVSDVSWADFWPELAREANRKGLGLAARGRSVAEQVSDRNIAKRLTKRDQKTGREMKVSAYEVRMWRERMAKLPFERFAAEVGADDEEKRGQALIDYWSYIRSKNRRNRD